VLVACTGQDEDNLIACQMAKSLFMVGRTIARVNDPNNEELFRSLGVDATVNSTRFIDSLIETEVDSELLVPLFSLGGGKLEIVQTTLGEDSPAANKPLKSLALPLGCLIVSIVRGGDPLFPSADTVFLANDKVVVLLAAGKAEALKRILSG